jgi:Arc/MetJ family transcription regulator
MKITMNIDEKLLESVMAHTGAKTKTHAVDIALREFDRREKLRVALETAMGDLSPEEIKDTLDPNYDLMAMRAAETPVKYGAKARRSRR